VHGKPLWGRVAAFLLIALAWAGANRLMRRLREAKDAADGASQAKTTFLATMSHEIRTPLNVILGMTHRLDRAAMPEEQRRQLEAIRQSGDALFAVVSDVLDLSQIESGQLGLERTEPDLRTLILRTLPIFTLRAEQKGLRLEHRIDPEVDGRYFGDPNRIRQIPINLLGNAVKFTSEGWVRLDVEVSATDGETRIVLFRVSDSGIGLLPEQLPHLFADFSQGDHGVSRRFAGAGLGPAICRRLAELMGGDIGTGGVVVVVEYPRDNDNDNEISSTVCSRFAE
jgi:signal transduction histidine kinase